MYSVCTGTRVPYSRSGVVTCPDSGTGPETTDIDHVPIPCMRKKVDSGS